MIIRESPQKQSIESDTAWPPKTPFEALQSSPSGRKRLQCLHDRGSPTPSPSKIIKLGLGTRHRVPVRNSEWGDDDEDEETLQLELQAIEAKLKLKRLKQAKQRVGRVGVEEDDEGALSQAPDPPAQRAKSPPAADRVQIPVSPAPIRLAAGLLKSPGRKELGIDKGLRGRDVSLKRPRLGASRHSSAGVTNAQATFNETGPPVTSFNERLARSRYQDREQQERREKIENSRSEGFGIKRQDISGLSKEGQTDSKKRNGSKEPLPKARSGVAEASKSKSPFNLYANVHRSDGPNLHAPQAASEGQHARSFSPTQDRIEPIARHQPETASTSSDPVESHFESFSSVHLSKRVIDHSLLSRYVSGKEIYDIPRLLQEVKSPTYDPPEVEGDYVVFGIVAQKSQPRDRKDRNKVKGSNEERGDDGGRSKFMVLRLTDLKWELDLFLFDTGFSEFWKLTPGSLIAVLNPAIMPPRPELRDTGKFSLKLSSSEDTVLEIGQSRDLGYCKSIKTDGKECEQWIDRRHTEVCDFHMNLQVAKARRGRSEVNSMFLFDGGGAKISGPKSRQIRGFPGARGRGGSKDNGFRREGEWRDRALHETAFIVPGGGRSTAKMLDEEDRLRASRGMSKEEHSRKRLAEKEKEKALAKSLGSKGNGMGSEYMRFKESGSRTSSQLIASSMDEQNQCDARGLGLLKSRASDVRLSPLKRKHDHTRSGASGFGWSHAYKRDALSPSRTKSKVARELGDAELPAKKKARFMLDKGIREPGRESLPQEGVGCRDEDEDLEIV